MDLGYGTAIAEKRCLRMQQAVFSHGALGARDPLWETLASPHDVQRAIQAGLAMKKFFTSAFSVRSPTVRYENVGSILFIDRPSDGSILKGSRSFVDLNKTLQCSRLGPLKKRGRIVDFSEHSIHSQIQTVNEAALV